MSSSAAEAATTAALQRRQESVQKRISKELDRVESELSREIGHAGILGGVDSWPLRLAAIVNGPKGTPYEGGKFLLDVRIPPEYPFKPPVVAFKTRVYHPNIDMKLEGAVGLSLLYEDWSPTHTIVTILQSLHDLLRNPNPDSPLECTAASQYARDRAAFEATARDWVRKYAS